MQILFNEGELMKVLVVGGGLGGLALASGLRGAGITVTVLERDRDLSATGGYHITLQRPVQDALARLLPDSVFVQILASAADGRRRDPDALWDPRGRKIGQVRLKGDDPGIDIDRVTLRLLLAEASGDDLVTGCSFSHWTRAGDQVIAHLDNDETIAGDVLIGADGVHSRVAQQLAGGPTSTPTGIVGVSGRTSVAALREQTRQRLGQRSSMGIGPHATGLYFGYLDPVGHAVLDAPELRRSITTEPTFIWGAMFAESEQTRSLSRSDSEAVLQGTLTMLRDRGWTDAMTEVIEQSHPDSAGLFRFHAASPDVRQQAPWPAGPVAALGDAVHATPPTAGMGAGAAIRDADDLTTELVHAHRGDKPLLVAIRDFQQGTRERGAEVIAASLPTIRQILATDTAVGATATRAALPVLAALQTIRPGR